MGRALEDFHIEGLGQNIPFLNAVMDQERFRSGQLSTNYIKDEFPDGFGGTEPTPAQIDILTAVGAAMQRVYAARARTNVAGLNGSVRDEWVVAVGHAKRRVKLSGDEDLTVELLDEGRSLILSDIVWRPGKPVFRGVLGGAAFTVQVAPAAEGFTIRHRAAKAAEQIAAAALHSLRQPCARRCGQRTQHRISQDASADKQAGIAQRLHLAAAPPQYPGAHERQAGGSAGRQTERSTEQPHSEQRGLLRELPLIHFLGRAGWG